MDSVALHTCMYDAQHGVAISACGSREPQHDALMVPTRAPVTNHFSQLEGLVTWTLSRVFGRLQRAHQAKNRGQTLATLKERQRVQDSLTGVTGENEMSEADEFSTYLVHGDERSYLIQNHGGTHSHMLHLLMLAGVWKDQASGSRHQKDEQCEVSDPDQWAVWRYGDANETDDDAFFSDGRREL
eukprot:s1130_g33.t1